MVNRYGRFALLYFVPSVKVVAYMGTFIFCHEA
jgi:hypothetical protein